MSFKSYLLAAAAAVTLNLTLVGAVAAGDMSHIMVNEPYARSSTANSKSGAAFMVLMNSGSEDDRLVGASSDVAKRVELHTHKEDANGVMKMMEVEEGFVIPAGGMHALARGGDHVMFMGLNKSLVQGEEISLTLTFEKAGDITVTVPVDLTRKPGEGAMQHKQGEMKSD